VLPDQFHGQVTIEFGRPGSPSLPRDDGYSVIKVAPSGAASTSESAMTGELHDEYFCGPRRLFVPPRRGWTQLDPDGTGRVIFFIDCP
jgi:hypothetical protein